MRSEPQPRRGGGRRQGGKMSLRFEYLDPSGEQSLLHKIGARTWKLEIIDGAASLLWVSPFIYK